MSWTSTALPSCDASLLICLPNPAANANPTILDRELAAHVVPIVRLIVDAGVERNAPRILRHAAILAGRIPNTSKKLAESPAKVRFARLDTSNGVQCLTLWRVFLLPMARDSAKAVRADLAVDDMMRVVGTTNPNPPRLRKQHAAIMNNALPFMERHNTLVKQIAAARPRRGKDSSQNAMRTTPSSSRYTPSCAMWKRS